MTSIFRRARRAHRLGACIGMASEIVRCGPKAPRVTERVFRRFMNGLAVRARSTTGRRVRRRTRARGHSRQDRSVAVPPSTAGTPTDRAPLPPWESPAGDRYDAGPAGVAQWQSPSLPSWSCGFDSRHPLASTRWKGRRGAEPMRASGGRGALPPNVRRRASRMLDAANAFPQSALYSCVSVRSW
jgi:hypothetical protein